MIDSVAGPAGQFARVGVTDNFYQTSAFIPMSFALVTTVHASGETNIGPHALVFPYSITAPHSMLLISRGNSGTAANLRRTGKCALNYIEFDRERLQAIASLGLPGQSMGSKADASPFNFCASPTAVNCADPEFPELISESVQVIECHWDKNAAVDSEAGAEDGMAASQFVLEIDAIYMRPPFNEGLDGEHGFPNMPVFMGYRSNGSFWFAEHDAPFAIAPPQVEGLEWQAVKYLGDRLDENVRFSNAACSRLTGVPRPFLKTVLLGIIAAAKQRGVTEVDEQLVDELNSDR
jgi:flavin reductase (DIM6/NTAB) family NADH-FMN oxidoreductase RutF